MLYSSNDVSSLTVVLSYHAYSVSVAFSFFAIILQLLGAFVICLMCLDMPLWSTD